MTDGNSKASVKFDAVQKSFGSVKVLEEFNLEVEPGEFLVLLGASGSGKTTALRILSGLETPSAGRVHIGERDVTEVLPKYRPVAKISPYWKIYTENIALWHQQVRSRTQTWSQNEGPEPLQRWSGGGSGPKCADM